MNLCICRSSAKISFTNLFFCQDAKELPNEKNHASEKNTWTECRLVFVRLTEIFMRRQNLLFFRLTFFYALPGGLSQKTIPGRNPFWATENRLRNFLLSAAFLEATLSKRTCVFYTQKGAIFRYSASRLLAGWGRAVWRLVDGEKKSR